MGTLPGLRANLLWTLAGNAIYGASQWAILSLIAKLGSTEMLGRYALAVSVATPPMMLAHLNLRAVLATDATREQSFADYLVVRHAASALAILLVALIAARSDAFLVTVLIGIGLGAENQSDLYFGALQRRERMDSIAISMAVRGVGSVAAVAASLLFTRSIVVAAASAACVRLLLLYTYDRPAVGQGEPAQRSGRGAQWQILRAAMPLGAVLMLVSLTTHLPRYAIERHLGAQALGGFAAVASFLSIGHLVTNALGQSATSRLARLYSSRDLHAFVRLGTGVVGVGAAVGVAGILLAWAIGPNLLRWLYRPEYAGLTPVLTAVMAASVVIYGATTLGYVNTSARAFRVQLPLFALSALVCGIGSEVFVRRYGLMGAPLALASAAAVQILGQAFILRIMLRKAIP